MLRHPDEVGQFDFEHGRESGTRLHWRSSAWLPANFADVLQSTASYHFVRKDNWFACGITWAVAFSGSVRRRSNQTAQRRESTRQALEMSVRRGRQARPHGGLLAHGQARRRHGSALVQTPRSISTTLSNLGRRQQRDHRVAAVEVCRARSGIETASQPHDALYILGRHRPMQSPRSRPLHSGSTRVLIAPHIGGLARPSPRLNLHHSR